MLISVVIPVKDDRRLFGCLDALLASQGGSVDVELIVVNNGSNDEFARCLETTPKDVIVVHEKRPGAFAARNLGIEVASGGVIMFTDADCVPDPDWVAQCLLALSETGADVIQGFSGDRGRAPINRRLDPRSVRRAVPGPACG